MKTTAEKTPLIYQIPSSAISIPSNFIFFKSLCGGESPKAINVSDLAQFEPAGGS
jgi:hypothetical protein